LIPRRWSDDGFASHHGKPAAFGASHFEKCKKLALYVKGMDVELIAFASSEK